MSVTPIKDVYQSFQSMLGKNINLNGWVRSVRDSKTFGFIELNDGSHLKNIQIVFENNLNNFDDICKVTTGSSLSIEGILVASEGNKQAFEVKATKVDIIGIADVDFPLQKKRHGFEFLREISYLRPRTNTFNAVFRVRSLLSFAIHKFFTER